MTDIEWSLTVDGKNVSCETLQAFNVTIGRTDEAQQPGPGSSSFLLVYDEAERGDFTVGSSLLLDADVQGKAVRVATHTITEVQREFTWFQGKPRNSIRIAAAGRWADLNRKLMPYAWVDQSQLKNEFFYTGYEPDSRKIAHRTDGIRAKDVIEAAGLCIRAWSLGEEIVVDPEGSDEWPGDDCLIRVDEDWDSVARANPVTIPADDRYQLTVQCVVLAGDNTLDVYPTIGGVSGEVQQLGSGLDVWTGEMDLKAGTYPVLMNVRGTPPKLTWATAGGVTNGAGGPARGWGDVWGPAWKDGANCSGDTWAEANGTWEEQGLTWDIHRGVFGVESMSIQDTTGKNEWGTDLIAYRNLPDEPEAAREAGTQNRGDYVRGCMTATRSVTHEARDGCFNYTPRIVRAEWEKRGIQAPILKVDSCDVVTSATTVQTGARMLNTVSVDYGGADAELNCGMPSQSDPHERANIVASDASLVAEYTKVDAKISANDNTGLWQAESAAAVAQYVIDLYADTDREELPNLTLLPLEKLDPDFAVEVLGAECGERLQLENVPTGFVPKNPWRGYIEQTVIDHTLNNTVASFTLSPALKE